MTEDHQSIQTRSQTSKKRRSTRRKTSHSNSDSNVSPSKLDKQRASEKARNDRRTARNKQALQDNPGSPVHQRFPTEKPFSKAEVAGLGKHERVPSQACNTCIARGLADKCSYRGVNEQCRACHVLKLSGCSYLRPRNLDHDHFSDMYNAGGCSLAHIRAIVARLQVSRQQESILRDAVAREQAIALSAHTELFNALRGFAINSQDCEPFARIVEDKETLQELSVCFSLADVGFLKDLEDEGLEESSFAGLVSRLSPRILQMFPLIHRHLENCGYDSVFYDSSVGVSTSTDNETDDVGIVSKGSTVCDEPLSIVTRPRLKRKHRKNQDRNLPPDPMSVILPRELSPSGHPSKKVRLASFDSSEEDVEQLLSSPQKNLSVIVNTRRSLPPISTLSIPLSSPSTSQPVILESGHKRAQRKSNVSQLGRY